jgi:NADPH2:quinone reductase
VKAIIVEQPGGVEVMRLADVPEPTPGAGQVLLRVAAAGINFIDVYHRKGLYKQSFPLTLGREAAGTVEKVGPGVTEVAPGDRVACEMVQGSYAELAVAPADRVVPLPVGVDPRAGAAVLLQGLTAHYLTRSTHPLQPGDTCVVHAAAGGLGLLLCQMARGLGARVIGTVSTQEKAVLAREAGAHETILYTQEDFVAGVKRITGGQGAQVIYDSVGRTTFLAGLDCLVPRGMMVLCGQSSGPVEPLDPQLLNQKGSLFLTRPTLAHYTRTREELLQRAGEVFGDVAAGRLKVRIGREFPLSGAAAAHRELEARRTTGKILLIP